MSFSLLILPSMEVSNEALCIVSTARASIVSALRSVRHDEPERNDAKKPVNAGLTSVLLSASACFTSLCAAARDIHSWAAVNFAANRCCCDVCIGYKGASCARERARRSERQSLLRASKKLERRRGLHATELEALMAPKRIAPPVVSTTPRTPRPLQIGRAP